MKKALSALLVATATMGATVVGIAAPATAAFYPCDDTILDTGTTYVGASVIEGSRTYVRVCVGASTVAYQMFEVTVHPVGPSGPVTCSTYDNYSGVSSDWGTPDGYVGATGGLGVSASPLVCAEPNGTYRVVVGGRVCAGAGCTAIGQTGAIVGVFKPVVGTEPGAGYQLYGTYLVVDNTLYGIGPSHDTYVWAGDGSITTGDNGALCLLGPNCVPSSVSYDGGTIVGIRLPVGGTTYVTVPGGARCVPLYSLAGPVPCG